jgi:hypothetical protein
MKKFIIILALFLVPVKVFAFDVEHNIKGVASIGAAYMAHLFMHEMGHQLLADEVGADSHRIKFFTNQNGKFYPGLSTYKSIPKDSILPYAVAGERMAGITFEYALQSYREEPTIFNKSLMFFSCFDFLFYTALANYGDPDNDMYDPNLIRNEIGCSKEALLAVVATKTILNVYRIYHPEANFRPVIRLGKKRVEFLVSFDF